MDTNQLAQKLENAIGKFLIKCTLDVTEGESILVLKIKDTYTLVKNTIPNEIIHHINENVQHSLSISAVKVIPSINLCKLGNTDDLVPIIPVHDVHRVLRSIDDIDDSDLSFNPLYAHGNALVCDMRGALFFTAEDYITQRQTNSSFKDTDIMYTIELTTDKCILVKPLDCNILKIDTHKHISTGIEFLCTLITYLNLDNEKYVCKNPYKVTIGSSVLNDTTSTTIILEYIDVDDDFALKTRNLVSSVTGTDFKIPRPLRVTRKELLIVCAELGLLQVKNNKYTTTELYRRIRHDAPKKVDNYKSVDYLKSNGYTVPPMYYSIKDTKAPVTEQQPTSPNKEDCYKASYDILLLDDTSINVNIHNENISISSTDVSLTIADFLKVVLCVVHEYCKPCSQSSKTGIVYKKNSKGTASVMVSDQSIDGMFNPIGRTLLDVTQDNTVVVPLSMYLTTAELGLLCKELGLLLEEDGVYKLAVSLKDNCQIKKITVTPTLRDYDKNPLTKVEKIYRRTRNLQLYKTFYPAVAVYFNPYKK